MHGQKAKFNGLEVISKNISKIKSLNLPFKLKMALFDLMLIGVVSYSLQNIFSFVQRRVFTIYEFFMSYLKTQLKGFHV